VSIRSPDDVGESVSMLEPKRLQHEALKPTGPT
jgi:hypothetical protein